MLVRGPTAPPLVPLPTREHAPPVQLLRPHVQCRVADQFSPTAALPASPPPPQLLTTLQAAAPVPLSVVPQLAALTSSQAPKAAPDSRPALCTSASVPTKAARPRWATREHVELAVAPTRTLADACSTLLQRQSMRLVVANHAELP